MSKIRYEFSVKFILNWLTLQSLHLMKFSIRWNQIFAKYCNFLLIMSSILALYILHLTLDYFCPRNFELSRLTTKIFEKNCLRLFDQIRPFYKVLPWKWISCICHFISHISLLCECWMFRMTGIEFSHIKKLQNTI